ncbi:hypothetical protein E4U52_005229 [Claviceps spartinae]|nr:hypothetical protein E4U52_005229 [Claviceps spartinae]
MPVVYFVVFTRWLMADAEEWDEKEERRPHKTQDTRHKTTAGNVPDKRPPAHSDPPSDQQPKPDTRLPRKRDEKAPDEAVAVLWGGYACAFDVRRRQSLSLALFASKLSLDGFTRQPIHSGQSRITTSQPTAPPIRQGLKEAMTRPGAKAVCMQRTTDDNMLSRVQT